MSVCVSVYVCVGVDMYVDVCVRACVLVSECICGWVGGGGCELDSSTHKEQCLAVPYAQRERWSLSLRWAESPVIISISQLRGSFSVSKNSNRNDRAL